MPLFKYFNDIPVITYHKVTNEIELGLTSVNLNQFKEQMIFLKGNGFQTILPRDYKSLKYSRKRILISFDDAYENIYLNAFPIMEELGFKGLIFPIANYLGKLNSWDANLGGIKFKHANSEQLSELVKAGWEIGSHSLNHLTSLKSQDLKNEVIGSKKFFEDKFSTDITSFSYPFGRYSHLMRDIVSSAYQYSFSGQMQLKLDPFNISRSAVYRTDTLNNLQNKIDAQTLESIKLAFIHKGAIATELYQKIF